MTGDLLSGLEPAAPRPPARDDGPPPPEPLRSGDPALDALARAFGHDHVLSYPRRNPEGEVRTPPPPSVSWLRGYSETMGWKQAERFRQALRRLDAEDRAALREELARDAEGG